uniref:Odorant receptor n=1 Tax=Anopheles melas TaxID=34690 RepID=A0A182TYK4_9DIPT
MIITVAPVTDARPQTPQDCGMFKFQRKILLIFGCWPLDRLTRRWYVKVLIAVNLITLAICIVGEFRYCLYAYQNDEHPRETGFTKRLTDRDQTLTKVLFHSSFITAILYGIIPYVMMAYNWFQGQYPLVKLLPFKVVLPYDSQDPTLFILTTIFLNYASVPTVTAMTSSDTLFSGVCLYLHGQFQAIRLELEALAETVDKNTLKSSAAETLRINLELRRINKRHQTIIDVVSEVRHAFTPTILIVHICAAFMICVISMAMFLAEGINKLTYMPYTFTVLMLLFMYSYGGTIVRESSEAIQTVAYGFPWYRFDRNTRHLVQMMMVRAKYGCNVDVPFFQTSMATFSVIVRSAMSYITLMKSFL